MTGDYRRANNGKLHEFAERRVSWKDGADKLAYAAIANAVSGYSQEAKALRELEKQAHIQDNQSEYGKGL